MAEKKQKKEEIERGKRTSSNKLKELEDKLAAASLDEDKKKVEKEISDLKEQEERWRQKEKELEACLGRTSCFKFSFRTPNGWSPGMLILLATKRSRALGSTKLARKNLSPRRSMKRRIAG